jgi:antirestriction protein
MPRIYVACLAAYNSGTLHGEWIDADQDAEEIHKVIEAMLKASPELDAEEWAIHAYEEFCGLEVGENEDIEKLAELAQLIAKHGAAFACYFNDKGAEYATEEQFKDDYQGEHESEKAFAEEWFRECNEIPAALEDYIDWDEVTRSLFITDFTSHTYEGTTYVFRNS